VSWVYLLWTHDEYGPERMRATLDRGRVVDLAKEERDFWLRVFDSPARVESWERCIEKLSALIEGGAGPEIYPLEDGWGGLHLQIVELA
jgi:hypothetical protein